MSYISIVFLLLLSMTFIGYFTFPIKYRWIVLLTSSVCFYLFAGIEKIVFVLASCLIAYLVTVRIEHISQDELIDCTFAEKKKRAKKYLILGVLLILIQLLYAKIGQNIIDVFINVGNGEAEIFEIIIPLGISYYTFAVLGYMADVYWKKDRAEHNFLKLLLYMIYFPQIVQGPIPRHNKLGKALIEGHVFNYDSFCFGLQRMLWGFFKKMVIADRFALVTNHVFSNYTEYTGLYFIVAILASAIQLYCDFSGCMDIVIGISECLSIVQEENFKRPFASKSCAEFWRRWHITLGAWFKDYVYMPIVINPKVISIGKLLKDRVNARFGKAIITIIPLATVWLLTGMWHGTGIDYILWGCYWGILIICSTIFAPEIKKLTELLHINTESEWWMAFQKIRTFLIFCGGRLLTAPGDITITKEIIKRTFTEFNIWILFDDSLYSLGLDEKDFWIGIIAVFVLWFISVKQEQGIKIRKTIATYPIIFRWIIYYTLIFSILVFGIYGAESSSGEFMYMQY